MKGTLFEVNALYKVFGKESYRIDKLCTVYVYNAIGLYCHILHRQMF